MKKLIIACAAITLAVIAEAATANWQITCVNIYDGKGVATAGKLASGSALIFDAGIISQSALFEEYAKGTVLTTVTGYVDSKEVSAGSIVSTSGANKFSYGEQSTTGDTKTYDFFFAIVDGDKIYISKLLENQVANGNANYKSIGFGTATPTTGPNSKTLPTEGFVAGGQWASSVPEPTSGLLVMLGVGLMALRRRRA